MTKLSRRINQALAARPRVDAQSLQEEEVFAGFGYPVVSKSTQVLSSPSVVAKDPFFSGTNQEQLQATIPNVQPDPTKETSAEVGPDGNSVVTRCAWCKRTRVAGVWFSNLSYPDGQKYTDGICPGDAALYFTKRFNRQHYANVVAYHESYGGR